MSEASALATPPIIDADGHIVEPDSTWTDHLDPRFLDAVPRPVREGQEFYFRCGETESFRMRAKPESLAAPRKPGERSGSGEPASGATDPGARLADMALDGIAQSVIYPTYGLLVQGVREAEAAEALCRAINDWMAEYCRHDPARLFAVGVLPQTTPEAACDEARHCLETLGMVGVWRRPERIAGTPALHDAGYEPLWSYLEEADRPFALHPGLNGIVPCDELRHRFDDDYSAMHAVHFPMEQMMGLTDMICFGVLDRHPRLRVAFLETGATWALGHVHRLDEHLELFGFPERPKEKPSDQFRRQCYVSVEEAEPGLAAMLGHYPDSVMFASDYPHGDGVFPGSTTELLETRALEEEQRTRVLYENARRFYSI
ncbi:MAG: amidohydrolase [Deltaproteobacteria bacterium]|jgi:predicted TIM-barrel fold metal-dependent hydrolase|nr:amidohydrolase [Deltaproteobacteria bacterium]